MLPLGLAYAALGAVAAASILGVLCLVGFAMYKSSGSREGPVRILVPARVDGQGTDQGRDTFYVKA